MNFDETTGILDGIPKAKVVSKAKKTVVGICAVALGLLIASKWVPPLSEWCVYALLVYGGYCLAGDLVRGFASFLPAVIRDIRAAVKGTNNGQ